jgi:hypothetical protein
MQMRLIPLPAPEESDLRLDQKHRVSWMVREPAIAHMFDPSLGSPPVSVDLAAPATSGNARDNYVAVMPVPLGPRISSARMNHCSQRPKRPRLRLRMPLQIEIHVAREPVA